jgi:hypothetical protein
MKCKKEATSRRGVGKRRGKKCNFKKNPWINYRLLELVEEKMKLYTKLRKTKNDHKLQEEFKIKSKEVQRETRRAKFEYYNHVLDECQNEPKKYWKVVNDGAKRKNHVEVEEIRDKEGIIRTVEKEPEKVADEFNEYYIGVVRNLLENAGMNGDVVDDVECNIDEPLEEIVLDENEVNTAIIRLRNSAAAGNDGLSNNMIKKANKNFIKAFTRASNVSLHKGICPSILKNVIVKPLFKNGDKRDVSNYRPIAIEPTLSKVLESCIKTRIVDYLEQKGFFSNIQHGYRKDRSVDTALFNHIALISESIEKTYSTVGVYLDLKKAFDTVNHKILIIKLKQAGISGSLLNWLKTYLDNRKQTVRIGGQEGGMLSVINGVPQGSFRAPPIFNIHK